MGCVLYRDADYGALAVIDEDAGIVTIDHGFDEGDFDAVLNVLERHCPRGPAFREDGSALWKHEAHREVVRSSLSEALARRGYGPDLLGARVVVEVEEGVARSPSLPTLQETRVGEAVERGIRRHLEVAASALSERGDYAPAAMSFMRQGRTDHLGRPLPFVRYRGLLRRPVEGRQAVEDALREALAPVRGSLARASVEESEGAYVVEVALAPSREVIVEYSRGALPTFESQSPIQGVRIARFVLNGIPSRDDVAAIEERAVACTAATSLAFPNNRTVVARVPSTSVEGDAASDHAFSERLAWLSEQLKRWDPALDYISSVEPVLVPQTRAGGLLTADVG